LTPHFGQIRDLRAACRLHDRRAMKWIVVALSLALAAPAWAEDSKLEVEEQLDVARAQLGAGAALTVVAAILGATSAGLAIADHGKDEQVAHEGAMGLGISGGLLAVIGLPLAIVGGLRMKQLKKRRLAIGADSLKLTF
jgi:hypothetical protein